MADRKKLTITEVMPPREIQGQNGAFKVVDFMVGSDKYTVSKSALFPHLVVGKTIDAEVETSVNGQWTNRKVTMIYTDNGQPAVEKKSFGGGGGYRGKSPEEVASIETQCYVKVVADLRIAGIFNDNSPLWMVALKKMGERLDPEHTVPQPQPARKATTMPPTTSPDDEPYDLDMEAVKGMVKQIGWTAMEANKWVADTFKVKAQKSVTETVLQLGKGEQKMLVQKLKDQIPPF